MARKRQIQGAILSLQKRLKKAKSPHQKKILIEQIEGRKAILKW